MKTVGVIGAGQIAEDAHLPALAARDDVSIAWITDERESKAARLARMYGISSLPISKALETIPRLDVCLLAIPMGVRANYLEICAASNVAVYAEKPFAKSPEQHKLVSSRFPAHQLAVGFQRRFYQSTQYLKALIQSRVFGDVQSVAVNFQNYSLTSGGGRYITDARVAGGGVTLEAAIHLIDIVAFILPVHSVATQNVTGLIENGIDYHIVSDHKLTLDEDEIPAKCQFSVISPGRNGIELSFNDATVSVGLSPDTELIVRPHSGDAVFELKCLRTHVDYVATSTAEAFACAWQTFLNAIDNRSDHVLSASNTFVTTEWVSGIYRMIHCD